MIDTKECEQLKAVAKDKRDAAIREADAELAKTLDAIELVRSLLGSNGRVQLPAKPSGIHSGVTDAIRSRISQLQEGAKFSTVDAIAWAEAAGFPIAKDRSKRAGVASILRRLVDSDMGLKVHHLGVGRKPTTYRWTSNGAEQSH